MNKYNLKNRVVLLQYNLDDDIYFRWYSLARDITVSNILPHFLEFINNILN